MELKLAVICETARERPDGRVDVIGIFDELHATAFPAVQERMTVVFIMEWTAEEYGEQAFRVDLIHSSGRKILGLQGVTIVQPVPSGRPKTRLIQPLEKVVFPGSGEYHWELVAAGEIYETARIRLVENPEPTPET
jgi:hypothetical protein